jgi:hypothetical protein
VLLGTAAPALAVDLGEEPPGDTGGVSQPAPSGPASGGYAFGTPDSTSTPLRPTVPGARGKIIRGVGYAPSNAPLAVKKAIWAANKIIGKPYRYGGGHASFVDEAYDCSGTVSYALRGGGLLRAPLDSSAFMKWGLEGLGRWITVYTNPGHAFVVIAGMRLDTSAANEPVNSGSGPRWRHGKRPVEGYLARHPANL